MATIGNVGSSTIMTPVVYTVEEGTTVQDMAKMMKEKNIGAVIVVRDEKMLGIVSERDIVRRVVTEDKDVKTTTAADIMTTKVTAVQYRASVKEILEIMCKAPFRHLPVLDGEKVIGIVSNRDLLNVTYKEI